MTCRGDFARRPHRASRSRRNLAITISCGNGLAQRIDRDRKLARAWSKETVRRIGETFLSALCLRWMLLKSSIDQPVAEFHKKNPLVAGIGKEELRDKVQVGGEVFSFAIGHPGPDKKLEVAGELVRIAGTRRRHER